MNLRVQPSFPYFRGHINLEAYKSVSEVKEVNTFATLWTAAFQTLLSMGFSRQEYWSGVPCPPPGDLPYPGVKPGSPALQADSLPLSYLRRPQNLST